MLGRCRLRRGVSLEVIVEEDDMAEVALDPAPLMEEDDDDDDEEEDVDSEHGARGSAPSSPRGRGGEGGEQATAAEERRRRRERRRTIGGLSRIRSVSCEALTLLDTSDMDMCCSEWDDDEDLATTNSNYVTLNRPISRRRILESSQTQCDSEDSGIEYHLPRTIPRLRTDQAARITLAMTPCRSTSTKRKLPLSLRARRAASPRGSWEADAQGQPSDRSQVRTDGGPRERQDRHRGDDSTRAHQEADTARANQQVFLQTGRFRDIKSNPSSKILRFDRSESDSGRRGQGLRDGSQTLPRLPSHSGARLSDSAPRPQPASTPLQLLAELRRHQESQRSRASQQPRPARVPAKQGASGTPSVVLRKPVVRGFNVKKALLEDPKSFLPHSHESKKKGGDAPSPGKGVTSRRHSHAYAREKARHHSDIIDRSDTESLASDLSDDSGVSNDSTVSSSASTSANYRALDAYAADPSFKWIDPSVMAKIRSVGTTVIFFGPRPRPRSQDGTSSGLQTFGGISSASKGKPRGGPSVHFDDITRSVSAAPRIVGVVRKRTPSTSSTGGSGHPTPTPTPTPSELLSDDSRASSPGGRSSDEVSGGRGGRWRAEGDNTVVYDFTRGHAQPGCV
ncbi:flocculation protein FLO11-like [Penaeus japonicus]|uniref:flocculation protein FLO11-like n=1 Tax=Penaeus japonicus TaxID=27405 RepID=UPI001C70B780|nr:flocculation protein FLO11-like [Penaeus japonicus]